MSVGAKLFCSWSSLSLSPLQIPPPWDSQVEGNQIPSWACLLLSYHPQSESPPLYHVHTGNWGGAFDSEPGARTRERAALKPWNRAHYLAPQGRVTAVPWEALLSYGSDAAGSGWEQESSSTVYKPIESDAHSLLMCFPKVHFVLYYLWAKILVHLKSQ